MQSGSNKIERERNQDGTSLMQARVVSARRNPQLVMVLWCANKPSPAAAPRVMAPATHERPELEGSIPTVEHDLDAAELT